MKFYFAPLEGITGYVFRNAHQKCFPGIDRYYAPFFSVTEKMKLKSKVLRDIDPANNEGIPLIPQVLTNHPEQLLYGMKFLGKLGYSEVNLNLGCPSGTVVPKGKGAGFLREPDALNDFFAAVFAELDCSRPPYLSVKTRIGLVSPDEAPELMEVFNRYPIRKLIIHPRTGAEKYTGPIHPDVFLDCFRSSRNPVCYNGDIRSVRDFQRISDACPGLEAVMIGRGLVTNPALVREIQTGEPLTLEEFEHFHDCVLNGYLESIAEERNALMRMDELWGFWKNLFPNSDRPVRRIIKSKGLAEYRVQVKRVLRECEFVSF